MWRDKGGGGDFSGKIINPRRGETKMLPAAVDDFTDKFTN
jgi:hypothetical protein